MRPSVNRLFCACYAARNPALAFSKVCSKVGWLARNGTVGELAARGQRHALLTLEGALNEAKHALLAERYGNTKAAAIHRRMCAGEIQAFDRALQRILEKENPPHD